MSNKTFFSVKKKTIKIAEELCYPKETIKKLQIAETENQLYSIMREARNSDEYGSHYI